MRAVLDPNVLISALLSPGGTPAHLVRQWTEGAFELLASPLLIAELERALAYRKLRRRISADDAEAFVRWLERASTMVEDPLGEPPARSPDPGDDYLVSLAFAERAALVSGDRHLLALSESELPIFAPGAFLELLGVGA